MTHKSPQSMASIPELIKHKIVFLGDQAVGKSSILNRYVNDIFDESQNRPTIGIDFISKSIHLQKKTVKLQLWDTAGQQQFKSLALHYIRDSAAVVIVFDVTNRNSFNNVVDWIQKIESHGNQHMMLCLVGNKIDSQRQVSEKEGKQLASRFKLEYWEVSAKNGIGINNFFHQLANKFTGASVDNRKVHFQQQSSRQKISLYEKQRTNIERKNKCC